MLVGNPVREAVVRLGELPFPPFDDSAPLKILVTGGSQGATILGTVVPEGLGLLPASLRLRLQVVQQCRGDDIDAVRARYAALNIPAELLTYIDDMPARIGDAHLVIARAGASTIAELTAAGRPAILVPLPIATDDHQTVNAREMAKAGGARMIAQTRIHPADAGRADRNHRQRPAGAGQCRRAAPCRSGGRTRRATWPTWSSGLPTAWRRSRSGPQQRRAAAARFAMGVPA